MSDRPNEEQENLRRLLAAATDIVGAATGATIGQVFGGSLGAAAGGAYGAMARIMLQDVALDFTRRMLGEREKARVGTAIYYFAQKYQEKLIAGEEPRQDGFFDDQPDDRAAAKELFEATLLAAQREHQEKKVRFFGNLMANKAFDPTIDWAQANHLIGVSEGISNRQLCLMSLFEKVFNQSDSGPINLKQDTYRESGNPTSSVMVSLLLEIYQLYQLGMIFDRGANLLLSPTDIKPATMTLQGTGLTLHNLMELGSITEQDLLPLMRFLQWSLHRVYPTAEELEARVWQAVSALNDEDIADKLFRITFEKESEWRQLVSDQTRCLRLFEKLSKLDQKLSGYQDQQAEGLITMEELRAKLAGIEEEREATRSELAVMDNATERLNELLFFRDTCLENLRSGLFQYPYSPESRHDHYKKLGLRVEVDGSGNVTLSGALLPHEVFVGENNGRLSASRRT
jgi:hypothetical protein